MDRPLCVICVYSDSELSIGSNRAHLSSCHMENYTFIYFFITTAEAMVLRYKWTIFLFMDICSAA